LVSPQSSVDLTRNAVKFLPSKGHIGFKKNKL